MLGVWSVAWLIGVVVAFRVSPRPALVLVVIAGLAMRLAALGGPPLTSDDLFRYSWDGRVQAAGIDPYAHAPDSAALAQLHEGWLWPDARGCAEIDRAPGCTRLNRANVRTIYPPVAEAWFAAVYGVSGIGAHHKAWQVAGLLTDMGAIGLLLVALRRWNRDQRWVALYALSPAPVLEIVNNGHVDGLAIVLVLAALIAIAPGTRQPAVRRQYVFGALIGVAALVKVYPLLFLLTVVAVVPGASVQRLVALIRAGVTAAVLGAIAYAPHVLRVGAKVLGYLPGYLREEHYRQGGRFLIADALRVPHPFAGALSALGFAVVVAWVLWRRPPAAAGAAALMGGLLLAVSPVQPWYAVMLLALATVAAQARWVAIVIAGYPYFFALILDYRYIPGAGMLSYTAAFAVVAFATWVVSRRRRGLPQPTDQRHRASFASSTPRCA